MSDQRAHVLVVEDNALVTSATRILLEDAGFRVSTASRVSEAHAVCRADPPDAILLDLRLPDGDGLTLVNGLREDHAPLPVIAAITGRDEPAIRARCRAAGCVEVLVKPVGSRALVDLVRSWLETPRPKP